MMNSCCRTAALRIFVRNITQIHFPPPTSAYRIPRYHSTLTRLSTLQRTAAFGSTRDRLLHTSCLEGREDGAWPPPEGLPAHQEPSPPKIAFAAAHDLASESTRVAIDTEASPQSEAASPQGHGEAQPKPLGKWARKKLKKAQEAATTSRPEGEEVTKVAEIEGNDTRMVPENEKDAPPTAAEKGNDEVPSSDLPVEDQLPVERVLPAQPAKKVDKPKPRRSKPEGKSAKFMRLKKEREERRRKKLEMLESGEQEGAVSMNKTEKKRALQEKKKREEMEQKKEMAKALEREAALAEKLKRKAELKAARKERRRVEFEESVEASKKDKTKEEMEQWRIQRQALKEKFPEGWMPRKKLSPDALAGIRALNAQFPEQYTTAKLAEKFQVSPEAIRRILKSSWTPDAQEEEERQERWFNRGKRVWAQWAELGKKPPAKWRAEGVVRDPKWNRGRKRSKPLTGDFLG
ncbi:hypothetical protein QBC41DRAFT_309484 [Cercophora samala]|uniref:Required for respiratory growth protein 9, mitochondrial n=1 Tax=Cercophora samala TaxID=330535 RepID=A0AA40DIE0_9PEZI|nr:hypothetical protein QBC41DRAFT_309484 [Cercophora samala]